MSPSGRRAARQEGHGRPGVCGADVYGAPGLGGLVLLLLWLLGYLALYWVIRLGVRHGVLDAQRRGPAGPSDHRGDGGGLG